MSHRLLLMIGLLAFLTMGCDRAELESLLGTELPNIPAGDSQQREEGGDADEDSQQHEEGEDADEEGEERAEVGTLTKKEKSEKKAKSAKKVRTLTKTEKSKKRARTLTKTEKSKKRANRKISSQTKTTEMTRLTQMAIQRPRKPQLMVFEFRPSGIATSPLTARCPQQISWVKS